MDLTGSVYLGQYIDELLGTGLVAVLRNGVMCRCLRREDQRLEIPSVVDCHARYLALHLHDVLAGA
jgi:hypothetical protein